MIQTTKDEIELRISNLEDELNELEMMVWSANLFKGLEDTKQYRTFEKALDMLRDTISELNDVIDED